MYFIYLSIIIISVLFIYAQLTLLITSVLAL